MSSAMTTRSSASPQKAVSSGMTTRARNVKPEVDVVDVEGDIDVSGGVADPEVEQLIPREPTIMRTIRGKRAVKRHYDVDVDYEEPLDERNMYNDDSAFEMELESDLAMVRRSRFRKINNLDYADHGPVEHLFDSSQRKRHVIVYNSLRYPGRASEWYFARKNNTTRNETYRCVQCRRYREEAKKGRRDDIANRPEARIIVQMGRFLTNPDEPLGDHICDFENNERTLQHSVWFRRALSKANSELRMHPEKPKQKFEQLLCEFREGEEYAHLSDEVREQMIDELTNSRKGFASRRRSFARNNRYAYNNTYKKDMEMDVYSGVVMHYICGMPECSERFMSHEERVRHRLANHPGVLFIDNHEELKDYNNYHVPGNVISGEEIVVTDEDGADGRVKREDRQYEVIVTEPLDGDEERYLNDVDIILSNAREMAIAAMQDHSLRGDVLNILNTAVQSAEDLLSNKLPYTTRESATAGPSRVTMSGRKRTRSPAGGDGPPIIVEEENAKIIRAD